MGKITINLSKMTKQLDTQAAKRPDIQIFTKRKARAHYIKNSLTYGGAGFVSRIKKYGVTETGEKLILRRHYLEALSAIGDLRISWVLTSGPSQVGKTLAHTFLLIDGVVVGKLNGAWFYDSRTSLDQYAPIQFRPPVGVWISRMQDAGYRFKRGGDRTTNTNYQVDGANAIFSFLTTSTTSKLEAGGAAAGGAASSFRGDFVILEERSQSPPSAADVALDRLANSSIPSQPRRDVGTMGGGMGIEFDMQDCNYYFYPHYTCSNCAKTLPLDPKGCVLKKVSRLNALGKKVDVYLSESGRPLQWHHTDINEAVKSAIVACSDCGTEISNRSRLVDSRYICTQTGITLADYLKSLPAGVPPETQKIAVHMSPLTREGDGRKVASEIIRRGLATANTSNWQQQVLGHYSRTEALRLTYDLIRDRIGAAVPSDAVRWLRLGAVDIGRQEDWLIITDFYLPPDIDGLTVAQIAELAIRNIVFAAPVVRSDIPDILEEYQVDYGFVDNEPSIEAVMNLVNETVLQMANQVGRLKCTIKYTDVTDGGVSYPCWAIRNEKFMLSVYQGFTLKAYDGQIQYRVPEAWEKWLGENSEQSPIRHLTAPRRDTSNHWHRPDDHIDDFYMAVLFSEASFYLKLTEAFGSDEPEPEILTYIA
jgi:hypothetical protein